MASLCVRAAAMVFAGVASVPLGAMAAVGRTPGDANVSPSGVAGYSIPILAPPGTHGMTPTLSLSYGHSGGSGWIGEGWDIGGLSAIARCPKTWAQDLTARNVRLDYDDRYCLDGNRLRLVSGSHGGNGAEYRTEIETFSRITSWSAAGSGPAYFKVELKNGLVYEYGNTTDSRIESLGIATARAWAVNKISDRDGNAILFSYTEDTTNGGYRLNNVQYTSNTSQGLTPAYKIQFDYETQPAAEIDSSYLGGRLIKDITRLIRVDVTYNSAIVRRYNVVYEPGLSNTAKSRVQSIQECAGSAGNDCLSATTFTYQNGTPGLDAEGNTGAAVPTTPWTLDVNGDGREDLVYSSSLTSGSGTWMVMLANASGYGSAINTGISNTGYTGAIAIDYNADGLDDLLVPYSGGTWWVMLGTTSGLALPVNTGTPVTATGSGSNAHAIDIDGDGLQDLVWADLVGFAGGDAIRYRLRVNGGTFSSTVSTLVAPMPVDSMIRTVWGFPNLPGSPNPDFNGDGRDDLIYQRRDREFIDGNPSFWRITDYTVPITPGDTGAGLLSGPSSAPVYGDFNGDGMSDLLYIAGAGTSRVRFATGTGFIGTVSGPNPDAYQGHWLAYDWNGDGFDDILARNASTGAWNLISSTGEYFLAPVSTGISTSDTGVVADINGDGLLDLAYKVSGVWRYRLHAGSYPDLLLTATDGFGNAVTFAYTSIAQGNYTKYADAPFPEQDYAGPMQVVQTLTASNGIGGNYTLSYQYYGARVHLQGRGFEGFYARRTHDSRNNLYAYEYFNRLFPYTGTVFQSDLAQPSSTIISRVENSWSAHTYNPGTEARFLPFVSSSSALRREVSATAAYDGVVVSTTTTTNTVDSATGTLSNSVATTTEASTANGVQAGAQYTQRTYLTSLSNDQTNWCIGRPGRVQQINSHTQYGGSSITRTTGLTWDLSKCRVTQEVTEPGNSQLQVTRDLDYDGFGNVSSDSVTGVGMPARTTTANWGGDGRFVAYVINALSQRTDFTWNAALGMPERQTDPNGIAVSWLYDEFGRRTRENRPDGTATTWTYNDCASSSCVNSHNKMIVIETDLAGAAFITDRRIYTDRFDRPIAASTRTLSGAYNRIDRQYDALGRVDRESAPCWWSACTQHWTTFSYDVLNRVTGVSRPLSDTNPTVLTTHTYYEGLTTRVVDALNKQSTKVANVGGGLARSIDHDGYYQNFDNDAFGNVVRVTDSASNTLLSNTFNIRGMRTAQSDMSAGSWSYTPNALGEIVSQIDAKSQSTSFGYDALGRMTSRTEAEGTTNWTWGTSSTAKNIGRLQSVAGPGYSESYAYDSVGRLQQKGISSDTTYTIDYSYNSIGALSTLTYPTSTSSYRLKLQYDYQNGVLLRVKDYNAPTTVFWTGNDMDARGNVISESLGNGVQTVRGYDAVTGLPDFIQSSSGSGSIQDLSYEWDQVGNLTKRQDVRQSLIENFYYDNLHRLTSSTGPDPTTNTYDARGNLFQRTGAVSSGNSHTISWYSYNLPNTINSAGTNNSSQFFYAPDRSRWKQVANYGGTGETTIYVGGLVEKVTLGTVTSWKHVIAGATGPVAVYTRKSNGTNEIHYLTKDSLGSIDSITNASGAVEVRLSFSTFGQRRNEDTWSSNPTSADWTAITNTTRHGFTGHEMLDNLNLTHMNGRVYDQLVGSFLSPDPFITEPGNTQGWNRYAYVNNNPLSATDPSGFEGTWIQYRADPPSPADNWRGVPSGYSPATMVHSGWDHVWVANQPYGQWNTEPAGVGRALNNPPLVRVPRARPGDPGSTVSRDPLWRRFGNAVADFSVASVQWSIDMAQSIADVSRGRGTNRDALNIGVGYGMMLLSVVPETGLADDAIRGMGKFGGIFSKTKNAAGGEVWTSTGNIVQSDFATIVNNAVMRRRSVNILSGAHGNPSGVITAERAFFDDDVAAFGGLQGVNVFDITALTPGEISGLLRGEGTTIGAFCNSAVCLAPF